MKGQHAAAAIRVAVAAPFPDIVRIHESATEYADEVEVCAMISNPDAVLDQARLLQPDVLLLSEELGPTREDMLARLGATAPDTRLVMLVAEVTAGAGPIADGVIRLDAPPDQLRAAILAALGRAAPIQAPAAHARPATSRAAEPSGPLRIAPAAPGRALAPAVSEPGPDGQAPRGAGTVMQNKSERARLVVVFSGKGGVGTSVIATNLATALAGRDARVALVDLDLQFGDVGMLLHVEFHPTTIDTLAQRAALDDDALEEALATSVDGVRVLPAPRSPEASDLVTMSSLEALLSRLSRTYDFIVVDLPGQLEERIVGVMGIADTIIVVSSFSLAAVKDTKVTLRLLQSLGIDADRVALVLNQTQPHVRFTAAHIERTLRFSSLGNLPFEPGMDHAVESGRPMVAIEPRSRFSQRLAHIADHVARAATPRDGAESANAGRWRLRFGRRGSQASISRR